MIYNLTMRVPDDANLEGVARQLERAAMQVRRMMSSVRAAHSMTLEGEFRTVHGVVPPAGARLSTPKERERAARDVELALQRGFPYEEARERARRAMVLRRWRTTGRRF